MTYCENYQNVTQRQKSEQMTLEKNGADRIEQINVCKASICLKKKKKKKQYLQTTIKLSAIKQGTPV